MIQYIIEAGQLTKTYRGTPTADYLDLRIPEDSIFGFLSPNGAGRSTTMKVLLGSINQDSGSIYISGTELSDHSRISIPRQTDSLIETPSYYGNLTAYENLQISCMLGGLPYMEISRVLSIVCLDDQKKEQAVNYSLGMKQRLSLANILLGSPKLVSLDEPTDGLDPADIHEMRELIKSLPEQFGMTVMIPSHLLAEMEQTAGCIGIISRRRLVFQDALSILQARSTRQIYLRTLGDTSAAALLREDGEFSVLLRENEDRATLLLKGNNTADGFCYSAADGIRLPFLPDHMLAQIFHILMNHGIDLYRAEEKWQSLEDIYLSMVREARL